MEFEMSHSDCSWSSVRYLPGGDTETALDAANTRNAPRVETAVDTQCDR